MDTDDAFSGSPEDWTTAGDELFHSLHTSQRDTVRMLFRELKPSLRRGATRRGNLGKCKIFLRGYMDAGELHDKASASLLDAVQPVEHSSRDVTVPIFTEGLESVAQLWTSQHDGDAPARTLSGPILPRWLDIVARPVLEGRTPPKYWDALLGVQQELSADEKLQALLRRNNSSFNKLFASAAMANTAGSIGRLGRGKALTFAQAHSIFARCNDQGQWLSSHGTELVISLVKAWSAADNRALQDRS